MKPAIILLLLVVYTSGTPTIIRHGAKQAAPIDQPGVVRNVQGQVVTGQSQVINLPTVGQSLPTPQIPVQQLPTIERNIRGSTRTIYARPIITVSHSPGFLSHSAGLGPSYVAGATTANTFGTNVYRAQTRPIVVVGSNQYSATPASLQVNTFQPAQVGSVVVGSAPHISLATAPAQQFGSTVVGSPFAFEGAARRVTLGPLPLGVPQMIGVQSSVANRGAVSSVVGVQQSGALSGQVIPLGTTVRASGPITLPGFSQQLQGGVIGTAIGQGAAQSFNLPVQGFTMQSLPAMQQGTFLTQQSGPPPFVTGVANVPVVY